MKSKWDSEKEELERLINVEKVSYEEIGRRYNCSGTNIKKVARRLGIELSQRRTINESETFNRGTGKKRYCLNCGRQLINRQQKYCCSECRIEFEYNQYIERWKNGEESGNKGACQVSTHIRRYLFNKYSCKCQKCGWGEENPFTHTIPLEIHHIDGDCTNNSEDNLELLCPNCHSLTGNFGSLNKNSKRFHRTKVTLNDD